ncbi:MAG TPA: hypothetical protein VKT31_13230 [Solirubrobacteraceae bacterium]|nr:hypothetical protein [Solirubrobacteraceae bacterium]
MSDWNLDDALKAMSQQVERAMEQLDLDELAGTIGVEAERAREWMQNAGAWLRSQAEQHDPSAPQRGSREKAADPFPTVAPHPLDLPTEEQGVALAALDSGRWSVEPGTDALTVHGQGPGPSDALGLVRELKVRDWIAADGELTLAGRHALARWLESSAS